MAIAPCKGCKDRCPIPNCHMTCEKYKEWKIEDTKAKEKFKQRNLVPTYQIIMKGWY